jgi:hypothetical protein
MDGMANDIVTRRATIIKEYRELSHNGTLRDILHGYLDEGINWHLFPVCWFDQEGECSCGYRGKDNNSHMGRNVGKAPFLPHGMKDATVTKMGVDEFLKRYPNANWGGYIPGQLVLDVDVEYGGYESLAKLEADIGKLPETRTHVSGGGGLHIIFRLPEGLKLSASKLKNYPGIDIKINGYLVMPPSIHKSGGVYRVQ